jgi:hypothetical protein
MKKNNNFILNILFTLFIIVINGNVLGQSSVSDNDTIKILNYQEKLSVQTDRDIYITGEQVWVKVIEMNRLPGTPSDFSKVVYLELLDKSNNPVNQIKVWMTGTSGFTGFRLSDTLSSGNYLIRAYTKWMTNYKEDLFFYKTLTVINPFKNIDRLIIPSGKLNADASNSMQNEIQRTDKLKTDEISNQINIKAVPEKEAYMARENVKINISVTDLSGNPVETDMTVSVVKPYLLNEERLSTGDSRDMEKRALIYRPDQLPEIEGPLLSGVIKNKSTNEPLKNIDISLSLVGKTARCQFVETNDKGEFNFVLREQLGLSDLVIQPLSGELSDCYVELRQPFCSTYGENTPEAFYLDSSKTERINNAVISMQINNIYEPFRQRKYTLPLNSNSRDFYGKPDRRIKMSDYIELRNIREIVKEILPDINVIKRNKKYSLKIINSYPYQPFENQALILVDGVPVYDIENLLNVSSKELEKIDIIYRRYYFSDYIFDGIVSFVTKKGDMSALESDNAVYRQVFEGYIPRYNFYSPDYSIDSLKTSHIPDFRNTLFWKPDLKSTFDGKASIEFFTSDEAGLYTIIVKGISSTGKAGVCTLPLYVK